MLSDLEVKELEEVYGRDEKRYRLFTSSLVTLLSNLCEAAGLEVEFTYGRAKEPRAVAEKVRRKSYSGLAEVTDKCGVRIVTRYQKTVHEVRRLLANEFDIIETVEHGNEDVNTFGYSSLHMLIRLSNSRSSLLEWELFENLTAEVQIRSVLQHAWATISRSLDYNSGEAARQPIRRRLFRVAALLEQADQQSDAYLSDLTAVRQTYQWESSSDGESLRLDYGALEAMWSRIPWARLDEAALRAGWRHPSVRRSYSGIKETPRDAERAVRLLDIAMSCGAAGIADILELARSADAQIARLRQIMVFAEADGYVPFAIGPDVAAMLLVCLNGEPAARAAQSTRYPLLPQLVRAALQCGGGAAI
jgi:ppGpp synthetase/RelA/SpoT-type nucleotidyltranferase